jgi:hypothetical protein
MRVNVNGIREQHHPKTDNSSVAQHRANKGLCALDHSHTCQHAQMRAPPFKNATSMYACDVAQTFCLGKHQTLDDIFGIFLYNEIQNSGDI